MSASVGTAFVGDEPEVVEEEVRKEVRRAEPIVGFIDDSGPAFTRAPMPVVDVVDEGPVKVKVPVDSPSRDVLDVAGRIPETPEEAEARVNLAYIASKDHRIELFAAVGSVERDTRQVDGAMAALREKVTDVKSLVPAPPAQPDVEELLVKAGMGDEAAEKELKRVRREYAVLQRLATEKTAKVLEEAKPFEERLAALERLSAKHYRTLASLKEELRLATIDFILKRAEAVPSLAYMNAGRQAEKAAFDVVCSGVLLQRLKDPAGNHSLGAKIETLTLPNLGTEATAYHLKSPYDPVPRSHFGILCNADRPIKLGVALDTLISELAAEGIDLSHLNERPAPKRRPVPAAVVADVPSEPWHLERPDSSMGMTKNYVSGETT